MQRKLPFFPTQEKISENVRKAFFVLFVFLLWSAAALAQEVPIGTADELFTALAPSAAGNQRKSGETTLAIDKGALAVRINATQLNGSSRSLVGEVSGSKYSSVNLKFTGDKVEGKVILVTEKKAYDYFSKNGKVFVKEVDIHKVICVDYAPAAAAPAPQAAPASIPPASSNVYKLQSFPSATAVVLLDFDGQVVPNSGWDGGNTITALPHSWNEADITEIWQYVSEDYRPFNLNITTDEAVYQAAPVATRQRVIFTPTSYFYPGYGGVAHYFSFTSGVNDPCWVFNGGVKSAGEAGSHEVGHTLGLSHDGVDAPGQAHVEYYSGQGDWAPIMGASYYVNLTQWSNGDYANSSNKEDDLQLIGGGTNGFGFRTDEAGSTLTTAKALVYSTSGNVTAGSNNGVISTAADIDVYSFTTTGGSIFLNVASTSTQPNLDVLLTLKNSAGTTVATANPTGTLSASVNATVASGTYYLFLDGTGNGSPLTTGYSDYASLGGYTITGSFPTSAANPLPQVAITSPKNGDTLSTIRPGLITATAFDNGTISSVAFYDGTTLLGTDNTSPYSVNYSPSVTGAHTLKAVATDNQSATANATITVYVKQEVSRVIVYKNCEYDPNGYAIALGTGAYTRTALEARGIANDDISSVKVSTGYEIVLFQEDNFQGASQIYRNDVPCLVADNINDWASSAIVRAVSSSNLPPAISITSPANGSSFAAGSSIVFTAAASDPDGSISSVGFYNGSQSLFADNTSPYTYTIPSLAAGTYTLKAVATDNAGATTTATVSITVTAAATTGIAGPACITLGSTYTYTFNQGSLAPTGINWFANSGTLIKDNTNFKKAYYTPASGNTSTVLHAGVNFASAPYYQEYTFNVTIGGCASVAAGVTSVEESFVPQLTAVNPFEEVSLLSLAPGDKFLNIDVYDAKGNKIASYGQLNKETFEFGKGLQPGLYMLYVETESTAFKKTLLKK